MAQRPSLTRRAAESFNRRFAPFHTAVYLRTRGVLGRRMTGLVTSLLLHTTGARTGLERTVALAYASDGPEFLIVASNFGGERPPAWLVNLRHDPRARVRVGRRLLEVEAKIVMPEDDGYERLFAIANRGSRGRYARYRASTRRPIPVVRLIPAR